MARNGEKEREEVRGERDCENEREEPSYGEREREGPQKSVSDRVMVRES